MRGFNYRRILLCGGGMIAALAVASSASAAETKGPVTDDIGVLVIPKGAPIQIGAYWVMSGADSALGIDEKRGVEIAVKDIGGKLVGHPIKLNVEDDGCNAEGGQTAATKLASNPATAIVIGPACSSAATPGAPILWKAGITDIDTAATAPALTAPERKPEYAGFVRTVYSDIDQGRNDAKYVHDVLKAQKIVTIHDGSPYAQQLATVMGENFKKLGGQVLSQEAVSPTDVDMHPVLTRVATEKPDVIYAPVFVAAGAQLLRQSKDIPGLEKVPLIGSSGQMAPDLIEAARAAIVGYKITYPDVSPEAMGKAYPKFVDEYKKAYGEAPISGYHANAYDGAQLAFKAIEKVAKTDASGATYIGRKALRDAVFATKFEGVSGPISCDQYGQCAQFKPAVYEFTNGDPKTFKIGENPKKIWP
ncbi:MAG: branched-chain amino acid ABC transporter substrate-binding protein [Hyphomicrobiales bacterium]|nr:branched-chain amino acid ABC transporter substrate-binding protein [Hyphomicrobiales bacterium]MBV9430620.1 branched-chain amino acid ABC transporter substrate-binding protein [Hyphomicrobiales bacterium]MBV9739040.1 branched-chain amino acid ABC transporter substrate-binding protein [Hyphomicrobiales bacterium]